MHIRFYRRVQPFCGIEFITDYSTEIKEAKQTKKCTNIFTIVVITVCCVCIYSYTLLMLLLAYRIRVYIYICNGMEYIPMQMIQNEFIHAELIK